MKKEIIDAVSAARNAGITIERACEIIMLPRDRYYAWLEGRCPDEATEADLEDRSSAPGCTPHKITPDERQAIVEMAKDDPHADLSHRKLAFTALDEGKVAASPSTFLRLPAALWSCKPLSSLDQRESLPHQHVMLLENGSCTVRQVEPER